MCRAPRPNRSGIGERLHRGEDPVEVEQRLAHAHEDDVREAPAVRREPARRVADLVDDLGRLEVAPEAELAGRAERAADGAAGLARDAQRVAFALAPARRVVHEHRLDEHAVDEAVERLLGQAAVAAAARSRPGCRCGSRRRARLAAPRAASGCRCGREASDAPGGLEDLARPVARARHGAATQAASSAGVRPARPGRGSSGIGHAGRFSHGRRR